MIEVNMGQIIKLDFSLYNTNQEDLYEQKLIRIRDEIEDYLNQASTIEVDDLAIALAAGRYASMKLTKLTGEESTKKFFNECIKTTLKQRILK
jgi:hypothetical protein|tara:strand:- start:3138 stop:3416 length:279 start_codon:yes stop_codon:yes gene_type:complete